MDEQFATMYTPCSWYLPSRRLPYTWNMYQDYLLCLPIYCSQLGGRVAIIVGWSDRQLPLFVGLVAVTVLCLLPSPLAGLDAFPAAARLVAAAAVAAAGLLLLDEIPELLTSLRWSAKAATRATVRL
jgi:hypothetical protein